MQYSTDDQGNEPEAVIAEPEAPPVEEPESEPEVTTNTEPLPTLTDPERERLQEADRSRRAAAIQQAVDSIDKEAAQVRAEKAPIYGDEVAEEFARVHKASRQRELKTVLENQQQRDNDTSKAQYQQTIGKEFGVSPEDLTDYDTISSMRAGARLLQRLAKVEKGVARPRATRQRLESNATEQGASTSDDALVLAAGEHREDVGTWSIEQLERLANR